eukprot:scaffold675644_cov59-Prasinocladus_malaysianus.AAC.1
MGSIWDIKPQSFPRPEPFLWSHANNGDAALGGKVTISNLHMANWKYTDICGFHNAAFTTNPTASDNSPVHIFSSVTKDK